LEEDPEARELAPRVVEGHLLGKAPTAVDRLVERLRSEGSANCHDTH
jgi:hypothetical protein